MVNFRTDMAVERNDMYKKQNGQIDGVEVQNEEKENTATTTVQ